MWDWIGAGLLLTSMLMLSQRVRAGWLVNAAGCAVMTYALWHSWAFVIFEVVCLVVATRGWVNWKTEEAVKQPAHW